MMMRPMSNNVELFEKKISPDKRPPSPGMAGMGDFQQHSNTNNGSNRRRPSPGIGSPLTPLSSRSSSSSPKRRPVPGGGGGGGASRGPPSPGGATGKSTSIRSQRTSSPMRNRPPSPGGGMDLTSSSPKQKPTSNPPSVNEQQSRNYMEPKRFVFSTEATGFTPKQIHIASQNQGDENGNQIMHPERIENDNQKNFDGSSHNHAKEGPKALGKKNNNPMRNNPSFFQKIAELDDSDEEDELNIGNDHDDLNHLAEIAAAAETNESPKNINAFVNPASHWVNLRNEQPSNLTPEPKEIPSNDLFVRTMSKQLHNVPSSEKSVEIDSKTLINIPSSDESITSIGSKKVTPSRRAIIEKLREVRARQSQRSPSPMRKEKTSHSKSPPKSSHSKSPPKSSRSRSPQIKIIRPSPIKASSPLFLPIQKKNTGDDGSVSSYSTKSFSSAIYGDARNTGNSYEETKNKGKPQSQKTRRTTSISPRRRRSLSVERKLKTQNKKKSVDVNSIKTQKTAMQKLVEKKQKDFPSKSDQSFSKLSSNLARLKALKEEQKLRQDQKKNNQLGADKHRFHYGGKANMNKTSVADDEFTVDREVLSVGVDDGAEYKEFHDDPKTLKTLKTLKSIDDPSMPKQQSQWALIMQNRLGDTSEDESSFEDEFKQDDEWDTIDDVNGHLQNKKRSEDIVNESAEQRPQHIEFNDLKIHISSKHGDSDTQIKQRPDTHDLNISAGPPVQHLNPPGNHIGYDDIQQEILHHQQLEQKPQQSSNQVHEDTKNIDINPYVGPYAQLLPRSTNPWIVRTNLPTFSSSITNIRLIQPPPKSIPTHQESIPFMQVEQPIQNTSHPNPITKQNQQNAYSKDGFSSTQSSDNQFGGGNLSMDDFALSHSTPDSDRLENQHGLNGGEKDDLEASTLIGAQVLSNDSDEEQKSSSQAVSNWWKSNYASTHANDVNDVVKLALEQIDNNKDSPSTIQIKTIPPDLDSDDDIFSGLESPQNQTKKPAPPVVKKIDKELDTILSGEEGDKKVQKDTISPSKKDDDDSSVFNDVVVASSSSVSESKNLQPKVIRKKNSSRLHNNIEEVSSGEESSINNERISSKIAHRGAEMMDSRVSNSKDDRRKRRERRAKRDDDTDESEHSIGIKSNGSKTNGSQTYDSRMQLSDKERKVWDDWDRKDSESSFTGTSTLDVSLISKERVEIKNERRSRSHEKLLMHAYIAMSCPPPQTMTEKGEGGSFVSSQPSQHLPYNDQIQQVVPGGHYAFEDSENQAPNTMYSSEHISIPTSSAGSIESEGGTTTSDAWSPSSTQNVLPNVSSEVRKAKSIVFQKEVLEKFCFRVKRQAIEVLKLNREQKWQPRYLTVSKEGTWLKTNGNTENASFCPLGLLWVKKFVKSKETSVLTIDKQGKGGMLLASLTEVSFADRHQGISSLTKRQREKYHDSCVIILQGSSSFVTLRCEKSDADAIIVGCNAIIEVLRGSKNETNLQLGSIRGSSNVIETGSHGGKSIRQGIRGGSQAPNRTVSQRGNTFRPSTSHSNQTRKLSNRSVVGNAGNASIAPRNSHTLSKTFVASTDYWEA